MLLPTQRILVECLFLLVVAVAGEVSGYSQHMTKTMMHLHKIARDITSLGGGLKTAYSRI